MQYEQTASCASDHGHAPWFRIRMALGFRIKWLLEEYKQTSLALGVWSEPQAQCVRRVFLRRVFIFQGSGRARRAWRGRGDVATPSESRRHTPGA